MTSREKILSAIAAAKPALLPLPVLPTASVETGSLAKLRKFKTILEGIGGIVIETPDLVAVSKHLVGLKDKGRKVASLCRRAGEGNVLIHLNQTATELESVDTAFIEGTLGVAENGSVWIFESQFVNRLLPFICQHLVIILDANKIVQDMHEAYRTLDVAKEGYGLFLAGPSKTADIEQSLVIGAHGARSTTVYLVNKEHAD